MVRRAALWRRWSSVAYQRRRSLHIYQLLNMTGIKLVNCEMFRHAGESNMFGIAIRLWITRLG